MKRVTLLLSAFISFQTLSFSQIWTKETKLVASDREADEGFGYAVARTDDLAVITSAYEDEDENGKNPIGGAGAAYIYQKQANGTWIEIQKIVASDRQVADRFGQSCAILGTTIIIGAEENDFDANVGNNMDMAGAVFVFEKGTNGLWKQTQKLVAPDRFAQSYFGCSVAAWGNYLVVGAWADRTDANGANSKSSCGSAYVYKKGSDKLWTFNKKLTAIMRRSSQRFGCDVPFMTKELSLVPPVMQKHPPIPTEVQPLYLNSILIMNGCQFRKLQLRTVPEKNLEMPLI